jgi:peptidoglycan/xylan/chitin deacetylase (PgdA/CDA1 family)
MKHFLCSWEDGDRILHKLFLTFDVEDFINDRSLDALERILSILKARRKNALFFITGHMAEKLIRFPKIVELLGEHEIGYHSTSHSVHPTIIEYTDVQSYDEAYEKSLARETAHINPLSGTAEGKGGIESLKELFPDKSIGSFRAPGFAWSPPHLDAMVHLGLKYDFSTNLSVIPVNHRGITFFPYPAFVDSVRFWDFWRSVRKDEVIVLDFHPNFLVNRDWWDSILWGKTNPQELSDVAPQDRGQTEHMFRRFGMLLRIVGSLQRLGLAELTNEPQASATELDSAKVDVEKVYAAMVTWPRERFGYEPRFIRSHLVRFLESS